MKRYLVMAFVLVLLLLLSGCGGIDVGIADPHTFVVIDRETDTIYHPDLSPEPEVTGERITFVQDGKVYILTGNWLVVAELKEVAKEGK